MDKYFKVLDAEVSLSGPEEVLRPIAAAYARFETPAGSCPAPARISIETGEHGEIRVDARSFPLAPDLDPTFQLYQQFLLTVLDNVGSCAVLHGAALVTPGGEGFLIAAPAGHGKSSLTLELVARGYPMLSDDYAPVDLETGRVHPYPRAVALLPGGEAPIPEVFRDASLEPSVQRLFDKSLVDVGRLLGEQRLAKRPVPLRHVLLLGGSGDADAFTWLHLATELERADRLAAGMRAIDGIEILEESDISQLRVFRLRLRHDRYPTEALMQLVDREDARYCEKYWDSQPDFTATPAAAPVSRRKAAQLLGRELLNRRSGSRFLERYPGGVSEVFFDLAGALRQTRCWRVSVGRFGETADLVEKLVGPAT